MAKNIQKWLVALIPKYKKVGNIGSRIYKNGWQSVLDSTSRSYI